VDRGIETSANLIGGAVVALSKSSDSRAPLLGAEALCSSKQDLRHHPFTFVLDKVAVKERHAPDDGVGEVHHEIHGAAYRNINAVDDNGVGPPVEQLPLAFAVRMGVVPVHARGLIKWDLHAVLKRLPGHSHHRDCVVLRSLGETCRPWNAGCSYRCMDREYTARSSEQAMIHILDLNGLPGDAWMTGGISRPS
jgi:hypothetical protein